MPSRGLCGEPRPGHQPCTAVASAGMGGGILDFVTGIGQMQCGGCGALDENIRRVQGRQ